MLEKSQPAKELVVMSTLVAGWSRLAAAMQHTGPPAGRLPAVGRPVPRSRQQIARSREQDASNAEPMGAFPGEDAPGTGAAEGMAAAFVGRGPKCIGNQELPVRCLPSVALKSKLLHCNRRGAPLSISVAEGGPAGEAKTCRVL